MTSTPSAVGALLLAGALAAGTAASTPAHAKAAASPPAAALPADSVYRVDDPLTDQAGRRFTLADGRGRPRVVTMFYTSCQYMCPLIVDSAKGVDRSLTAAEREGIRYLLVSLDPARDDVAKLKATATERGLDGARWTLARTEPGSVRRLAAVLGVRYRELADGEFNHTSSLVLLDGDGRVLARTEQMGAKPDPAFVAAVKAAVGRRSD